MTISISIVPTSEKILVMLFYREEADNWILEEKLEAHTDWVRDVAWAPSIGLPRSRLASCSQVSHVPFTSYKTQPPPLV